MECTRADASDKAKVIPHAIQAFYIYLHCQQGDLCCSWNHDFRRQMAGHRPFTITLSTARGNTMTDIRIGFQLSKLQRTDIKSTSDGDQK